MAFDRVWAVIVSWMLEILRDIVSGTWSVSLAVAALPVRRLEGPGSSNSSESDVMLCGVNRSEPSFRRACTFAAGDLSIAGAAGIVEATWCPSVGAFPAHLSYHSCWVVHDVKVLYS